MVRLLLIFLLPAVICLLHTPGSSARKSDLRTVFVCVLSLEIHRCSLVLWAQTFALFGAIIFMSISARQVSTSSPCRTTAMPRR